jgi:hypothetical protein
MNRKADVTRQRTSNHIFFFLYVDARELAFFETGNVDRNARIGNPKTDVTM